MKERTDAFHTFEEHLSRITLTPSEGIDEKAIQTACEAVDHEKGMAILNAATIETDEYRKPFITTILKLSLIDEIPADADLFTSPQITARGLEFLKKHRAADGRRLYKIAPFIIDVRSKIDLTLLPRQIDIAEEMDKSGSFFMRAVAAKRTSVMTRRRDESGFLEFVPAERNRYADVKIEDVFEEEDYILLERMINLLGTKPLYEISTNENLSNLWRINSRALLNYIFADTGDNLFDQTEHVLFTYAGVYIMENDEIKLIPANYKYKFLFLGDNYEDRIQAESDRISKIKKTGDHGVVMDFTNKLKDAINTEIRKKGSEIMPLNPLEEFNSILEAHANVKLFIPTDPSFRMEELMDVNCQEAILEILSEFHDILHNFIPEIHISHTRSKALNTEDEGRLTLYFKTMSKLLQSPRGLKSFLHDSSKSIPVLTIQDALMYRKYPDTYRQIMRWILLANIFRSIISSKNRTPYCRSDEQEERQRGKKIQEDIETYNAFKKIVGGNIIHNERLKLQTKGFKRNSTLTEESICLHYFIHLGMLYMDERGTGTENPKFPHGARQFFDEHIAKKQPERTKITE